MQNIGLNTEQLFKSGHSLWFQNSKPPLSWGFQDNLSKSTGRHTLGKQSVNTAGFALFFGLRTEKAAGLVHLDARWYNPHTTRFIQPDLWNFASTGLPKEIQHEVMQFAGLNSNQLLKDPGQQMRFGYVANNALKLPDYTGLSSIIGEAADGGIITNNNASTGGWDVTFSETTGDGTYNQSVTVTAGEGHLIGEFEGSSSPNPSLLSDPSVTGTDAYPQIESGSYSTTHGTHKGSPALVLNNNGNVPTTTENPRYPSQGANATFIHVHSGYSSTSRGSAGCPTIEPSDWDNFINSIPSGSGTVTVP